MASPKDRKKKKKKKILFSGLSVHCLMWRLIKRRAFVSILIIHTDVVRESTEGRRQRRQMFPSIVDRLITSDPVETWNVPPLRK